MSNGTYFRPGGIFPREKECPTETKMMRKIGTFGHVISTNNINQRINLLWKYINLHSYNTPFPNCIIMTSLKILELFLRHSKNITEFSKNKSLKTQILRKKSCFDQIL